MALKRLIIGISALSFLFTYAAIAQLQQTTADQDGIFIMDALGRAFSAPLNDSNLGPYLFLELEETSQRLDFPFPILKDVELVANSEGSPKGAYAIDRFGGQYTLNMMSHVTSPDIEKLPLPTPDGIGSNSPYDGLFQIPPYWGFDVVEDLEIAPNWLDATFGFKGMFILDADGVVHPLGDTNLPQYAFYNDGYIPETESPSETPTDQVSFIPMLFPETLDNSGSTIPAEDVLSSGPILYPVNRPFSSVQVNSVTPIITYFGAGSDIARDMEISVEYVSLTMPSQTNGGIENRVIAMTNGYYILDGLGAVHSCRLPLDFDVNNDGNVNYEFDVLDANGEVNPLFGAPINNTVLSVPWLDDRENFPYFGGDFAVDIEITPSGKGFFLLDKLGAVHRVGDAKNVFPPVEIDGKLYQSNQNSTFFGIPIASDLNVITNKENPDLGQAAHSMAVGYVVLDAFGVAHTAGLAETFNISSQGNNGSPIPTGAMIFGSLETGPVWLPQAPPIENFSIGNRDLPANVAADFRDVTVDYMEILTHPMRATDPGETQ